MTEPSIRHYLPVLNTFANIVKQSMIIFAEQETGLPLEFSIDWKERSFRKRGRRRRAARARWGVLGDMRMLAWFFMPALPCYHKNTLVDLKF